MYRLRLIAVAIIWFLTMSSPIFGGRCLSGEHPVLVINKKFVPIEKENLVSPYMTCIYALDLLEHGGHLNTVRNFIIWYVEHLNKTDRFGVSGTIYDYRIDRDSGEEHSTERYDSADGYAGMFLYLVNRYYEAGGDAGFVQKIFPSLKDTVYLIYYLRDSRDGLVRALPIEGYHTKYLMDNVEAWLGVSSYLSLAETFEVKGDIPQAKVYVLFQNELKSAILNQLYDSESTLFDWAKTEEKNYESNASVFYPDMFAQMHLLAFWGNQIDRKTAEKLWHKIKILVAHKDINVAFFGKIQSKKNSINNDSIIAIEQLIIFNWAKAYALKNNL